MFGNFWTNVVIVVNFWSFKKVNFTLYKSKLHCVCTCYILNDTNNVILKTKLQIHDEERRSVGVTPEKYSRQLSSLFENKFDLKRGSLPLVFIDTHYNR